MKIDTNEQKIDEILTRSVSEILPSKKFLQSELTSGRRLRFYIGTDATGTSLHLGHATNYMILEKIRSLGHEVIFLIGDFTSRIGDPTDKSDSARTQLTREDVVKNTKTWMEQIKPVIDINNKENPVEVLYNNDWLQKLKFEDVINLASNFTVQQMLERDMFEKRIKDGKPLYMHELFYPLMQGYDSVEMDVDVEVCGNDQKFNALTGRTLLKRLKNKEKFVVITTLLENPITGEKMMSKSMGTGVFLDFDANKMYGAIMAQADENMNQLFVDCTRLSLGEINNLIKSDNPRDTKMQLAFEITKIYHGEESANHAEESFVKTFQERGVPEDIEEVDVKEGDFLVDILLQSDIVESKNDFKRLITGGAIKDIDTDEKILDDKFIVDESVRLKIGKKRFISIKV